MSSSQPAPGSLGWPPQVIRPQGRDQPTSPSKLPSKSRVGQAILQVSNGGPRGLNSKVDTTLSLPYTGCCPWYFPQPGPDPESPILQLPWPPSGTSSLLPLPDCLTAPSGRALPGYNRPISRGTYIAAIFLERLFKKETGITVMFSITLATWLLTEAQKAASRNKLLSLKRQKCLLPSSEPLPKMAETASISARETGNV